MKAIFSFIIGLIITATLFFASGLTLRSELFGIIGVIITFLLIRDKLKIRSIGFWSGELLTLIALDAYTTYVAMTIDPFFAQHPSYTIGLALPSILISAYASYHFIKKDRALQPNAIAPAQPKQAQPTS